MRTTLNLDEKLIAKARAATGIQKKTELIHKGLQALVQRAAIERLIKLAGSMPRAKSGRRRRPT